MNRREAMKGIATLAGAAALPLPGVPAALQPVGRPLPAPVFTQTLSRKGFENLKRSGIGFCVVEVGGQFYRAKEPA